MIRSEDRWCEALQELAKAEEAAEGPLGFYLAGLWRGATIGGRGTRDHVRKLYDMLIEEAVVAAPDPGRTAEFHLARARAWLGGTNPDTGMP